MNCHQCTEFAWRTHRIAGPEPAAPRPDNAKGVFGLSPDATGILCTVTDALREFPEARTAVAAALKRAREAREASPHGRQ